MRDVSLGRFHLFFVILNHLQIILEARLGSENSCCSLKTELLHVH